LLVLLLDDARLDPLSDAVLLRAPIDRRLQAVLRQREEQLVLLLRIAVEAVHRRTEALLFGVLLRLAVLFGAALRQPSVIHETMDLGQARRPFLRPRLQVFLEEALRLRRDQLEELRLALQRHRAR